MADPAESNDVKETAGDEQASESATEAAADKATATVEAGEEKAEEKRPEQTVTVEDVAVGLKKLTIEVPESRIKSKIEDAFKDLEKEAVVPGFRRGRAPRRLLEKRLGSSLRGDVKGQLLSEAYTQAIEDEKIEVMGEPHVKDVEKIELPESGSLKFEVEVEVMPEVMLPDLSTLNVTQKSAKVEAKAVDELIERYRGRIGSLAAVEDETIAEDDFVTADVHIYPGRDAGKAENEAEIEPISHHHDARIVVNGEKAEYKGHVAGIVVTDLGKRLAGQRVGDEVVIAMTGPSGHEDERIKDKPIELKIKITHIHRLEPATVEQVVEQFGAGDEQEMRDEVRNRLERQAYREQQADMQRQAMDQLMEKVEMQLPEKLTQRQIERSLGQRRMELAYDGKSEEEIEQGLAEARSESEDEARKMLKRFFIINQAAKDLDTEVTEDNVNYQIAMMAMQQGRRPEKLRQELRQRGELDHLYMQIRENKALTAIVGKATVTKEDGDEADEKKADE